MFLTLTFTSSDLGHLEGENFSSLFLIKFTCALWDTELQQRGGELKPQVGKSQLPTGLDSGSHFHWILCWWGEGLLQHKPNHWH